MGWTWEDDYLERKKVVILNTNDPLVELRFRFSLDKAQVSIFRDRYTSSESITAKGEQRKP